MQKQKIKKLIDELIEYSNDGHIIIVEGKRDKISLQKLNIKGRIEVLKSKSLLIFSETVASYKKNIIILTDWDRRGDMIALKILGYLQNLRINPNTKLRAKFKSCLKKDIKDVESLYNYYVRLDGDYIEYFYDGFSK
ncbi:MAG: toprim domain-containing protein [Methanosarcinaceae archaeon]|jgi:5S rRNA maturation endonuclease (ribonuclease M5)|nr:toprim domain-containing protein [Methanosarcinaceae archaeon]NKQ38046.1 toprim domain-containing protein [Methanosarcinales archaeon]